MLFLLGLAALGCLLASWPLDYLLTVLGESNAVNRTVGRQMLAFPALHSFLETHLRLQTAAAPESSSNPVTRHPVSAESSPHRPLGISFNLWSVVQSFTLLAF